MNRKNMMLVISGSALGLTSVAVASPDLDRAYAAELRADAAAHTSLLQAGGAGHDGTFFIGDAAGNNRLNIGGLLQMQYILNSSDKMGTPAAEDLTMGFDAHRVQLDFSGNVVSPNWEYAIGLEFGSADALDVPANLRHAWIKYNYEGDGAGSSFTVGQFKVPVIYEGAASDATLLSVERSLTAEFFDPGYTQGIMYTHQADDYTFGASINDGGGWQAPGIASPGNTAPGTELADWGVTARFDYKFEGDWSQFADGATSWKGSANALRVGGGIHYQTGGDSFGATDGNGSSGGATAPVDYLLYSIDARYESNGWNVGAAIIGNSWEGDAGNTVPGGIVTVDGDSLGFVVDGGVFVSDDVELFGRYEFIDVDSDFVAVGSEDSISALTFGGNYFLTPESHAAKVTVDVVFMLDDAVMFAGTGGVPGFANTSMTGGADDEYAIRGQLQLAF